jgi:hypothetical protein
VAFPFALPGEASSPTTLQNSVTGRVPGQVFVLDTVLQGVGFDNGTAAFEVLLGMDVISSGLLVVGGGNGTSTFSF